MPDSVLLAGLRTIEAPCCVAAPPGGMALAQLGADIIRVDPVGGAADTTRWPLAPPGARLYWAGLNKGKRSVTLDFGPVVRTLRRYSRRAAPRPAAQGGLRPVARPGGV